MKVRILQLISALVSNTYGAATAITHYFSFTRVLMIGLSAGK